MIDQILELYTIWAPPVITIAVGVFAGWIFKRFIHSRIKKITSKTSWKGDDIIFGAIEKYIIYWFFLVAFYMAAGSIEIGAPYNLYAAKLAMTLLMLSVTMTASTMAIDLLNQWSESKGSRFPSTAIFPTWPALPFLPLV